MLFYQGSKNLTVPYGSTAFTGTTFSHDYKTNNQLQNTNETVHERRMIMNDDVLHDIPHLLYSQTV